MFFCEPCREKRKWPTSFAVSRGPCELCKKVADCYDVPSRMLATVSVAVSPPPLTLDSPVRAVLEALEGLSVTQTEHNEPCRNATDDGFESDTIELTTHVEYAHDAWGNPAVKLLSVVVDGTGPASVLEAYVRLANEVRKVRYGSV